VTAELFNIFADNGAIIYRLKDD